MYISARERKILERLLRTQTTITVKEIADMLDVSQRTVHRDLSGLEKFIFTFHLKWIKKAGVGFQLSGKPADKKRLRETLGKMSGIEFSAEERKTIILSTLLESDGPVKLFAMANELHVTTATISNDLDQLEDEISANQLLLVRKRGYGVEIAGDEANKRATLANLISTFLDPFDYIAQVKENIWQRNQDPMNLISNRLLGLVNPQNLKVIERTIQEVKKQLSNDLADSSYIGLIVHVSLAIERLQKGDSITFDRTYLAQLRSTPEYNIAEKMIRELEQTFHMRIPEDEIGYITMHLLGAKRGSGKDLLLEDTSMDIAYQAKELISFVSDAMNADLAENNSLLTDLVAHIKPAIFRLAQGMKIKNPLTIEIKTDYEELFQLIQEGTIHVFSDMDFPDDEVAYLVLHFASALLDAESGNGLKVLVLCSSGIGSAKMLATRLRQRIPEIQEVINRSVFDVEKLDETACDLIVSTIPLNHFLAENDYILVSPMLNKTEEHRVKKAVRKRLITNRAVQKNPIENENSGQTHFLQLQGLQEYMQILLAMLGDFAVSRLHNEQHVTAVLSEICSSIEKTGKINDKEDVLQKLLDREQMGGLGIPDSRLALFHTRSAHVIVPTFHIFALDTSLRIKGMDGKMMDAERLLIMLAPQEANQKILEVASFLSGSVIQSPASIKLFETGKADEIKSYLAAQFHKNYM